MTPWEIQGHELVACNCAYGCPCQFNALPTNGNCEAMAGFHIVKGNFGTTRLDGLSAVGIMWWPGPIHEGGGKALMVIDEKADDAQRQALLTILSGNETDPGATIWNVFAGTMAKVFDPEFKAIEIDVDVDARTGRVFVDGIAESSGVPIRNPVTGEEHRVRIDLPNGFEYSLAEMGSATFKTRGPIAMSHKDSYAQFARLHLNNHGVVKSKAA
ncbi:MAG TPA: DUF1326 domain-containing protein [Woeseiaceae bacterium]|nr:DUF1326 domain-containing protein [Woeseiaceae bacterium]